MRDTTSSRPRPITRASRAAAQIEATTPTVRKSTITVLLIMAPLIMALMVTACGSKDSTKTATATTEATTVVTEQSTTTTTAPPAETDAEAAVAITPYFMRDGRIGAGHQRVVQGPAVARASIEALLEGPDEIDELAGLNTAVVKGVTLMSLEIADGVATVGFNRAFETADTRPQVAQVVFTLTQFATVDKVQFLIDGEPNGATGVMAMGRDDLERIAPAVLVESPTPGSSLPASFEMIGTANTFEANVPWAVEDTEGNTIAQGFATAESGSGTRGAFRIAVSLDNYSGPATVLTWMENMDTGAREQLVRIPVEITA